MRFWQSFVHRRQLNREPQLLHSVTDSASNFDRRSSTKVRCLLQKGSSNQMLDPFQSCNQFYLFGQRASLICEPRASIFNFHLGLLWGSNFEGVYAASGCHVSRFLNFGDFRGNDRDVVNRTIAWLCGNGADSFNHF